MPAANFTINVTGTVTHKLDGSFAGGGAAALRDLEDRLMSVFRDELGKVSAATTAGLEKISTAFAAALGRVDEDFTHLKDQLAELNQKLADGTISADDLDAASAAVADIQSKVNDVVNVVNTLDPDANFPVRGGGVDTPDETGPVNPPPDTPPSPPQPTPPPA